MAKSQIDSEGSSDWQLEYAGLLQRTTYLLESELWSDCMFLVGPTEAVVKAHKVVLSIASPVFAAMFYGELAQENGIHIPDMQPNAFRTLLRYLYTDKLNLDLSKDWEQEKVVELIFGLYYGAKKYMLPHLEKECIKYLMLNSNPKNVCRVYHFANFFEENGLMEYCIKIISRNTKEVLNADSFENAELHTVNTIFSLDHLSINNELVLFDAAARYFKAHEKRTQGVEGSSFFDIGLPSNKNVAGNSGNRFEQKEKDKLTVRAIMEKIRFLTLTPEQFAEGPAQSSLLTESEAFAVLMNIASSNVPNTPMPCDFSKSRVHRNELKNDPAPTFSFEEPKFGFPKKDFSFTLPK